MRLVALLLPLLILVTACESDEADTSPVPRDPTGLAALDDLAPALEDSYELLNYEEYERLIHEDFVFRVDPANVLELGVSEWSAAQDLESTRSMFDGEFGVEPELDPLTGKPTGNLIPIPPVQSIQMSLTPEGSGWEEITVGEFAGTRRRVFDLDMTVTFAGSSLIEQIRGKQVLYAEQGTLRGDTSGTLYWQIRGWQDQGVASRRDSSATSLGQLKARY